MTRIQAPPMALVSVENLSIRFRGPSLLDDVSCLIEPQQRIGLLGRNGAGKTTFLRILAGTVEPDHGSVKIDSGKRIALLPQNVPSDLKGSVSEVVRSAFGSSSGNVHGDEWDAEAWEIDHQVTQVLSRMELNAEAEVAPMSAGMKRRVLLARSLVQKPDLLLLDEPTNHLDIKSIRWLEDFLDRYDAAFMFITHDRQFLRRLAKRILEIDAGRLFDWSCDYETFLKRKEAELAAQEKQEKLFDKKLAEEEAWIRQGIKARRTRNEGRVRALKELRLQRSERRDKLGTSNLQIQEGIRSGNLICKATEIDFAYKSSPAEESGSSSQNTGVDSAPNKLLDGFSTTIMRGDKVGVVGPNGVGKTTLLKVLLGELEPDAGTIRHGANLQVAYFDQLRQQLEGEKTVEEDVSDGYQTIKIGDNSRHVLGYLQDFLFTPERARTKISNLSGGERNRVLLAKLFAKPANVIVLDEPTNDLDAETLEMLEERLLDYKGTLLVVSHDREFLNNVVTSTLVFEPSSSGGHSVKEYVGGYDDWLRQFEQQQAKLNAAAEVSEPANAKSSKPKSEVSSKAPSAKKKLSFKENKELELLPGQIEECESSIAQLHEEMADPGYYKQEGSVIAAKQSELDALQKTLEAHYARWEELESRA